MRIFQSVSSLETQLKSDGVFSTHLSYACGWTTTHTWCIRATTNTGSVLMCGLVRTYLSVAVAFMRRCIWGYFLEKCCLNCLKMCLYLFAAECGSSATELRRISPRMFGNIWTILFQTGGKDVMDQCHGLRGISLEQYKEFNLWSPRWMSSQGKRSLQGRLLNVSGNPFLRGTRPALTYRERTF